MARRARLRECTRSSGGEPHCPGTPPPPHVCPSGTGCSPDVSPPHPSLCWPQVPVGYAAHVSGVHAPASGRRTRPACRRRRTSGPCGHAQLVVTPPQPSLCCPHAPADSARTSSACTDHRCGAPHLFAAPPPPQVCPVGHVPQFAVRPAAAVALRAAGACREIRAGLRRARRRGRRPGRTTRGPRSCTRGSSPARSAPVLVALARERRAVRLSRAVDVEVAVDAVPALRGSASPVGIGMSNVKWRSIWLGDPCFGAGSVPSIQSTDGRAGPCRRRAARR